MSFPRYPAYKDSGVEWLGRVPEHWRIDRLKRHLALLTEKSDSKNNPVALENIEGWSGRFIASETEFEGDGVQFDTGDILFGKLRPYLAKVLLAPWPGEAVGDFHVLRAKSGVSPRFAQYLMLTRSFIDIVDGSTFGSKMPRAGWDFVGDMPLPIPSFDEQKNIAGFLDRETAKIDALVAEQEQLVTLLKEKRQAVISHAVTKGLDPSAPMKDSGVEWLGEVPAQWAVAALNYRYEVLLGKMLDEKKISGNHLAPYLRNVDVQWDRININELPQMDFDGSDVERYGLRAGDLLVCEGGDVGRSAIWHGELTECYYQKALHRLRPRDASSDLPRFQFYLMQAAARLEVFTGGQGKATIAHLTAEALRRYRFAYPGRAEQERIVEHLDRAVSQFDELIHEAANTAQLLQERRSALISAAVTGQIDVRGLAPAPMQAA
jgi:type I restriction enzyme, S subunit